MEQTIYGYAASHLKTQYKISRPVRQGGREFSFPFKSGRNVSLILIDIISSENYNFNNIPFDLHALHFALPAI